MSENTNSTVSVVNKNDCQIAELAEQLGLNAVAKRKAVLIIGAGVSVSAGIPAASGIMETIQKQYTARWERENPKSYADHMKLLPPRERKDLINTFIKAAKLNYAHLCMAKLIQAGYVDRVLTTNFDTLLSRSLALENIFPGIYDFALHQEYRPEETSDISIFHLHGQKDGYKLLNTEEEVEEIFKKSRPLFEDTFKDRTIIVVGYSGVNDPVVEHLKKVDYFNHSLYWITYEDHEPEEEVKEGLLNKKNYSYCIKGYNADSFFLELNNRLNLDPPGIIHNPFSLLLDSVNQVAPYEGKESSTDSVKEVKQWISQAIDIFEQNKPAEEVLTRESINEEELIKLARETWMHKKTVNYENLRGQITKDSPPEAREYFTFFLNDWGQSLYMKGMQQKDTEAEETFKTALARFNEALELQPDDNKILLNKGKTYYSLASLKEDEKRRALFEKARDCLEETVRINESSDDAFLWYGMILGDLADFEDDKVTLSKKALDMFNKALIINSLNIGALNCKAYAYYQLAKYTDEKEVNYNKAVELFKEVLKIDVNNTLALRFLAKCYAQWVELKSGSEVSEMLMEGYKYSSLSVEIDSEDSENWYYLGNVFLKQYKNSISPADSVLLDKAVDAYDKAESLEKYSGLYNLSCCYALKGEYEKAVSSLIEVIEAGKAPEIQKIRDDEDLKTIINDERIQTALAVPC